METLFHWINNDRILAEIFVMLLVFLLLQTELLWEELVLEPHTFDEMFPKFAEFILQSWYNLD